MTHNAQPLNGTSTLGGVDRYRPLVLIWIFVLVSDFLINALAHEFHLESTRTFLVQWLRDPGTGDIDSWGPMRRALDWLQQPHQGTLYQSVFFTEHVKFQYPPTSLLPLALLRWLGVDISNELLNWVGWVVIGVTALVIGVLSLRLAERADLSPGGWSLASVLAACAGVFLTLTFYPIMLSYTIGQVQTWINALFALVCICWISDRRLLSGMLIGAICLLKPQFAMFPIWALLRRQSSFLIGWVAVVAPVLLISLGLFGLDNHLDYLSTLRFLSRHGENYFGNQSVNGMLNRMLFDGDNLRLPTVFPPYNPVVYFSTLASSVALILAALFLRGRYPDRGGLLDMFTATLTLTIASPIAWEYHYGILLPILMSVTVAMLAEPRARGDWKGWVLLAASYTLTANFFSATKLVAATSFNFVQSYILLGGLLALWLLYRVRMPATLDPRP